MFDADQVADILTQAVKAVNDARVPDELKAAAFERAVDLLAQGGAGRVDAPAGNQTAWQWPPPAGLPEGGTASLVDKLAARLRLSREVIEHVYTQDGDQLAITVDTSRLARSKSAGAREVAILVAAAGQVRSDEPTPVDDIRREAELNDRFDGPNFAATLSSMKGTFLIGGTPRSRTFRLTKPGWAAAGALVSRLAGVEETAA
jgi:hypothetical protein